MLMILEKLFYVFRENIRSKSNITKQPIQGKVKKKVKVAVLQS